MFPAITDEMRRALALSDGCPIEVIDAETNKVYVLSDVHPEPGSIDSWLQREIRIGIDDVASGRVSPWNVDEILAAGRKRLSAADRSN